MLAKTLSAFAGPVAAALVAAAILVPLAVTSPLGTEPMRAACHGPNCGG